MGNGDGSGPGPRLTIPRIVEMKSAGTKISMLTAYDALVTDRTSPIFHYAKRAYFIVDRQGVLRYTKVQQNPLELLRPEEVLQALKDSGAK